MYPTSPTPPPPLSCSLIIICHLFYVVFNQVNIDCFFQYFLRRDDLKLLHDTYDLQYADIFRSNAIDALKGATTAFTTEDFGENRAEIEQALFKAIRLRLGGKCCKKNCADTSEGEAEWREIIGKRVSVK